MAVIFSVNLYPSSALDGTVESQSFEFTVQFHLLKLLLDYLT